MKYLVEFEDNDRGCVHCPYSEYKDDWDSLWTDEDDYDSNECGFYCRKYKRYLGNYVNDHGLIPFPDWCHAITKVIERPCTKNFTL